MRQDKRFRIKNVNFQSGAVLVAPILFWWTASYPANMSPDSLDVWNQALTKSFHDWHTISYSLFVYVFSMFGNYLPTVSLAQGLLMMVSLRSLVRSLSISKTDKSVNLISSFLFATPFIGPMSMTLWKDVPFTSFLLLGLSSLVSKLPIKEIRYKEFIPCFLFFLAASLFRHDAIVTISITLILLSLLNIKFKFVSSNKFLPSFALTLTLTTTLTVSFLLSVTNATHTPPWLKTSSFLHDLASVESTNPGQLTEETRNILDKISSGDSLKGAAYCQSFDEMVFSSGFDVAQANDYANLIPRLWIKEALNGNTSLLLSKRICRTSAFLPAGLVSSPERTNWVSMDISTADYVTVQRPESLSIINAIGRILTDSVVLNGRFIGWPGLHLVIILFFVLLYPAERMSISTRLMISTLAISRSITLFLGATASDFRFGYTLQVMSITMIAIWINYQSENLTPHSDNCSRDAHNRSYRKQH